MAKHLGVSTFRESTRNKKMDHSTFFREVANRVGCDTARAEALSSAVFGELRDRLTVREVEHAEAQMDSQLKSIWRALDRPAGQVRRIHASRFVSEVRKMTGVTEDPEAERVVCAVFAALHRLFGSPSGLGGEAGHIMSQLPKDLRRLWLKADLLSRVGAKDR
jgi:uncharacterized protein (DUF2267 family)